MPTASADARRRRSLIASTCVQNEALGTTDFVDSKGSVRARRRAAERQRALFLTLSAQLVFRTTPLERHRVVAQIGTACPGASAVLTAPVPDEADAGVACS